MTTALSAPEYGCRDSDGPLRIALVTVEFAGPTRNGGIGTACRELASTLLECGHRVAVLFAGPVHDHDAEFWRHTLALEGIEFTPLRSGSSADYYRQRSAISAEVCRWLEGQRFDIVHFHDWLGFGLQAGLAKRSGRAFADTLLCTTLHGPTSWVDLGNDVSAISPEHQEIEGAERISVECSDVVISPSRFLLDHVLERGWQEPRARYVRQNILGRSAAPPTPFPGTRRITELVFFGRLEKLKGLDLFCDAVDLLHAEAGDLRLTFLGRLNTIAGEGAATYIEHRAARWQAPWRILSEMTREQALAFLEVPGRCAVMPSRIENCSYAVLECIGRGIPFLASNVGGTPELVCRDQRATVLFENTPEALCEALGKARGAGIAPVPPAVPFERTRRQWQEWHSRGCLLRDCRSLKNPEDDR